MLLFVHSSSGVTGVTRARCKIPFLNSLNIFAVLQTFRRPFVSSARGMMPPLAPPPLTTPLHNRVD